MSDGIPNGWVETTLDSVAIWSSGGTPSRTNPHFFSGSIPWLKTGELGERFIFDSEEKITSEAIAVSSAKIFPRGSVVLAMYGATIGKASILGVDSATNQACAVGTPDAVDSRLLYYFLLSQHQAFVDAGKGGAQPNISQGIVKNWTFLLPPKNEQTRIVEKLEELFSDLDAGIAELRAAQKKLAQYRQSLLKAAVEGALTAEWRTKNKPKETGAQLLERILKERRTRWEEKQLARFKEQGKTPPKGWQDKYPQPVQPDTTNLPELPEGWVWASAGMICESIVPNRDKPLAFSGDIPWITTPDFEEDELYLSENKSGLGLSTNECKEYRARIVPANSVVMTCVGRLGISAVLKSDAVINQQLHAFVPWNGIVPEYLAFVVQSQSAWLNSNATSTTILYLNKEKCESMPVALPSIAEMALIANILSDAIDSANSTKSSIKHSLTQAAAQRKNILKSAFSGQLVAQDPNDEPASLLLERIRAERQTLITSSKKALTPRRKPSC